MNLQEDDEIDLYAVLNVEKSAGHEEIQRSYKQLSKTFHPDRRLPGDKEDAEDFFVLIKKAHDVLSDPVLRLAYDHGGLVAVDIIKRSQVKASQDMEDPDVSGDENDIANGDNFYANLQNAKTKREAMKFIRELVETYQIERSIMQKSPIGVSAEMKHVYDNKKGLQGGLGGSLRVSAQRQLAKSVGLSVTGQTVVQERQRRLFAGRTTSVGLSYQPDNQSFCHVEYSMNQTNKEATQISFQTNRRFANGSDYSVGMGGGFNPNSTWMYSLTTKRIILLGSLRSMFNDGSPPLYTSSDTQKEEEDTTKLVMTWSGGATLGGQLQAINTTLRNLTFPQWKVRLSLLDSPFFKITLDDQEEDTWHGSFSWDWGWWRVKVTKEDSWDTNWTLRYGIKYDTKGLQTGRVWTIILQLENSDDWILRVPIAIVQKTNWLWPVSSMVMLLLGQRLREELLELWSEMTSKASQTAAVSWARARRNASLTSANHRNDSQFTKVMSSVAEKKRQYELKEGGLVIIRANWTSSDSHLASGTSRREEDVTTLLQYWVTDSRLELPAQQNLWWGSTSAHPVEQPTASGQRHTWAWNCMSFFHHSNSSVQSDDDAGTLYIRYQFEDSIYEIIFQGDELLLLPNSRATVIGEAGRVE